MMSNNNPKSKKAAIIAVAILLVLVIAAMVVYFVFGQPSVNRPAEATAAPEKTAETTQGQEPAGEDAAAPSGEDAGAPAENDENSVTIVVSVTHADGSVAEFMIGTEAPNLRGALEQENLIAGDESQYGLYVKTVDGETADDGKQEWWCFTKGGDMLMTGVDDTLIADGEHYEIVFTVGW